MSDTPPARPGKFRSLNAANTYIGELRERIDELARDLDFSQSAYARVCEELSNLKKLHSSGFGMAQLKTEGEPVAYNAYESNDPTQRLLAEADRRHELGYWGRLREDLRRAWKS